MGLVQSIQSIQIEGNRQLYGQIRIQGSKNAVLPIMAAAVLIPGTTVLEHCPAIKDVILMQKLLESMGCHAVFKQGHMEIDASSLKQCWLKKEYIEGMRSSIILLGAMLGRFKEAEIGHPGGCIIGKRPIDFHLMALEKMGAEIVVNEDRITARSDKLTGAEICFPVSSVGATENALLAAVAAEGVTILHNAATEPEIVALCHFLTKAGADIQGIGSRTLVITGTLLHEVQYEIPADRIVTGTYLLAAAAAGGRVVLEGAVREELGALLFCLQKMGIGINQQKNSIEVVSTGTYQALDYVRTAEYPGFATDLQPQLAAVLTCAAGNSMIEESIFENRFGYAEELRKMGAEINQEGRCLKIRGKDKLQGTFVEAKDLRGGAALVLAGLRAEGTTNVIGCQYIERGYEDIVGDLKMLGAGIEKREVIP